MRRREFIKLFGGTALAWPLAGRAQQANRMHRIGFIYGRGRPTSSSPDVMLNAFTQKMQELGYVEGKNLSIEWRFANGDYALFPGYAAELARMNVEVIVTNNLPGTQAAQKATSTIPIVFASMVDPVGAGVVKSLARPEGNVTGLSLMSIETIPKQIELLAAVIPKLSRIALLVNPQVAIHAEFMKRTQISAQQIGARALAVEAKNQEEIERGFASLAGSGVQAIIIPPDSFFGGQRSLIAQLAMKSRVPAIFPYGSDAEAGGLLSYGPDLVDYYRRAAGYVDKILKGAKPSGLPIEQPTIFQFMVNLKTAKALGIKIPPLVLMRADQVIE